MAPHGDGATGKSPRKERLLLARARVFSPRKLIQKCDWTMMPGSRILIGQPYFFRHDSSYLRLEIAYAYLTDRVGCAFVETVWVTDWRDPPPAQREIREALNRRLGDDIRTWPPLVRHRMFGCDSRFGRASSVTCAPRGPLQRQ